MPNTHIAATTNTLSSLIIAWLWYSSWKTNGTCYIACSHAIIGTLSLSWWIWWRDIWGRWWGSYWWDNWCWAWGPWFRHFGPIRYLVFECCCCLVFNNLNYCDLCVSESLLTLLWSRGRRLTFLVWWREGRVIAMACWRSVGDVVILLYLLYWFHGCGWRQMSMFVCYSG